MSTPDRARCFGCDRPIRRSPARSTTGIDEPGHFQRAEHREARWHGYGQMRDGNSNFDAPPLFCSLKCALRVAVVMVRAGHRIVCGRERRGGGAR